MLPFWEVFGDGAWTSRFHRRGKGIQVGDLVLFKVPINNGRAIKRVAGLPGDYVLSHSPESGRDEMIQVSCCCAFLCWTKAHGVQNWVLIEYRSSRFQKGIAGFWVTTYLHRGIPDCMGRYLWH